jgi:hypothetical protein
MIGPFNFAVFHSDSNRTITLQCRDHLDHCQPKSRTSLQIHSRSPQRMPLLIFTLRKAAITSRGKRQHRTEHCLASCVWSQSYLRFELWQLVAHTRVAPNCHVIFPFFRSLGSHIFLNRFPSSIARRSDYVIVSCFTAPFDLISCTGLITAIPICWARAKDIGSAAQSLAGSTAHPRTASSARATAPPPGRCRACLTGPYIERANSRATLRPVA